MESFIPPSLIAVLYSFLSIARFENQRWVRSGRSADGYAPLLVLITGFASLLFGLAYLVAYWFYFGWEQVVGLIFCAFVAGLIASVVSGDSPVIWMLATILIWPLMAALLYFTFLQGN